MRFVDTNVLLYTVDLDPTETPKHERARQILEADDLALSIQVLQEFYSQATRKNRRLRISHENALLQISFLYRFPIQEMTLQLFQAALTTKHRYQINYWDAAIIEAARALRCDTVLSEDLNHGQDFGGVRVMNPFLEA